MPPLKLNGDILERKNNVKNLGVIFDENMFWTNQINTIVGKAYGRLKQANKFRNFLSLESRFNLIEIYILSLFNYGDVLVGNMSGRLANKIQRLQIFKFVILSFIYFMGGMVLEIPVYSYVHDHHDS